MYRAVKGCLRKLTMTKFDLFCFELSVSKAILTIHITIAIPETILGNRFSSGKWGSKRPVTGFLSTAGANAAKVGRGLSCKKTEKHKQWTRARGRKNCKQNFLPCKISSDELRELFERKLSIISNVYSSCPLKLPIIRMHDLFIYYTIKNFASVMKGNLMYSYMTYLFLLKFQHIPLISESVFFSLPVLQEKHGWKI